MDDGLQTYSKDRTRIPERTAIDGVARERLDFDESLIAHTAQSMASDTRVVMWCWRCSPEELRHELRAPNTYKASSGRANARLLKPTCVPGLTQNFCPTSAVSARHTRYCPGRSCFGRFAQNSLDIFMMVSRGLNLLSPALGG